MSYWSKLVHWFTSLGGQSFEPTLHICSYFFIFLQASATQFKTGGFIPSFSFTDQALNLPSSLGQPQRSHPWSFVVGPDFFFLSLGPPRPLPSLFDENICGIGTGESQFSDLKNVTHYWWIKSSQSPKCPLPGTSENEAW